MVVDLLTETQKEDMREIFQVKLKTVPEVSVIWIFLSRKMPNRQLSDKLFKQIIETWIDLTCLCYSICGNFEKKNQLIAKRDLQRFTVQNQLKMQKQHLGKH